MGNFYLSTAPTQGAFNLRFDCAIYTFGEEEGVVGGGGGDVVTNIGYLFLYQ